MNPRLAALFCAALLGLLLVVGLAAYSLGGWPAAIGWAVVAGTAVVVVAARTRAAARPRPLPAGRTCTCCTSSVTDPVKVV